MLRKLWSLALLALVAALLPLAPAGAQEPDPPESPVPVEITEGSLRWGVKSSFTGYVSAEKAHPSDGATIDEERVVTFPLVSGTYDEATGSTEIQFGGQVRYASYCGYSGIPADVCLLDVTLKDPLVVITPDEQTLYAHLVSRPSPDVDVEIVDYGVVPLVNLDISQALVEAVDGTTNWSGITSGLTEEGAPAFGGFYNPGVGFDQVWLTYTGPGGPPDLGEVWAEPGSVVITEAARWTQGEGATQPPSLFLDEAGQAIHLVASGTGFQAAHPFVRAIDPESLQPIDGATFFLSETPRFIRAFDPATHTVFFNTTGMDAGVSSVFLNALTYNPDDHSYDQVRMASIPASTVVSNLGTHAAWDAANERLVVFAIERDGSLRTPKLFTWHLEDGAWVEERHALPMPPHGFNAEAWYGVHDSGFAIAADGSVLLGRFQVALEGGGALARPSVLRLVIGADGVVTSGEIPGTGSQEVGTVDGSGFMNVTTGADGSVWFVSYPIPGQVVQEGRLAEDGSGVELVGDPVPLPDVTQSWIADPVGGLLWLKSQGAGSLMAVDDGRIVAHQAVINFTRYDKLAISSDRTLYSVFRDESVTPSRPGVARFDYLGTSPTVIAQPESVTATLGIGEASEEVTFSVAGIGDPAPDIQWQARPRGTTTFANIESEISETLMVDATASDDGTQYRAIFSNLAGELATEPAILTVLTAPTVGLQPTDISVIEGESAELATQGGGNPEPDIAWQRYSGGFWTTIGSDDDQFEIDGGFLTITETNTDMSGAQFRARISNEVATVYSDVVTLTVLPDLPPPPDTDFDDVPADHPFFEQISWLVDNEIAEGYEDGSFRGQSNITRQAVAAFLYRFAGEPEVPDDAQSFVDIPEDHPFFDAISWLAAEEITDGYDDGTFRGDQPITREAVAAFLYRFAGEPEVLEDSPVFIDVPEDHPFFAAISWLAVEGIVEGFDDDTFRPADNITREAVAAFLHAYAQLEG